MRILHEIRRISKDQLPGMVSPVSHTSYRKSPPCDKFDVIFVFTFSTKACNISCQGKYENSFVARCHSRHGDLVSMAIVGLFMAFLRGSRSLVKCFMTTSLGKSIGQFAKN